MRDLLSQGADVHLKDNAGWTALHEAGNAEVAQLLLEVCVSCPPPSPPACSFVVVGDSQHGADPNEPGPFEGNTPLYEAVKNDNVEVVALMLNHFARTDYVNRYKYTSRGRLSLHIFKNIFYFL